TRNVYSSPSLWRRRIGMLSSHIPGCDAVRRRPGNRTHSCRSASGAGTALPAPKPPTVVGIERLISTLLATATSSSNFGRCSPVDLCENGVETAQATKAGEQGDFRDRPVALILQAIYSLHASSLCGIRRYRIEAR